ncbi:hypothetical protein DNTS_023858 [Danionella cerebrum]|uniref:Peroxisome assembly protein 12 n=1 Tax=Danionella cerebrum TaxID=2873325 RepID=A0A553NMU1_9TELE|nr:hypothetical protein DNTS_029725 [Danionella translucida]TRZ04132.1 hypothetical protein DNTS_023858 [Danionella translucida]
MAERGAHLTSTAPTEDRPSVFEVLAQDSLMRAVRPALLHAVKVLATSNPARYGFLWRMFDEIYLLLDMLLQHHFLTRRSASFSENFYGLKRVGAEGTAFGHLALRRGQRWRSWLLIALLPYLQNKLGKTLARQRDEDDYSIRLPQSLVQKMYRAFLAAYPFVSMVWDGWIFCQQLLYVFGKARTHSPLLWLAGVELSYLTAEDIRSLDLKPSGTPLRSSQGTLAVSLSSSLSITVFFLQFLEWWYSSENQSTVKSLSSLPTPPPPLHLHSLETSHTHIKLCLLCRKVRNNDTALATSGYVFCYKCIYAYVKAKHRCPVTGFPSGLQHLIKIYTPEG